MNEIQAEKYIYTTDEKYCEVLNPIIEKAIYAVESARSMERLPVTVSDVEIYSGSQLVENIENGQIELTELKKILSKLITKCITNLS